jgi:hypothetical protein
VRVRVGARPPACARDGLTTRQARSSSRCRHRRGKSGRAGHASRACGDDVVVLVPRRRLPVRASCPVAQWLACGPPSKFPQPVKASGRFRRSVRRSGCPPTFTSTGDCNEIHCSKSKVPPRQPARARRLRRRHVLQHRHRFMRTLGSAKRVRQPRLRARPNFSACVTVTGRRCHVSRSACVG